MTRPIDASTSSGSSALQHKQLSSDPQALYLASDDPDRLDLVPPSPAVLTRRTFDKDGLMESILEKLVYSVGKSPTHATRHDWFFATALAVRDSLVDGWMTTTNKIYERDDKRVYYLSVEFLIGRLLADALRNLGLADMAIAALAELGVDGEDVLKVEPDAALGNGGLGRLAACFMDSMATLAIAGFGYGIRYEHGLFKQGIADGWQVERPEDWLAFGNPWEFERPEAVYPVRFYGQVRESRDAAGKRLHLWEGGRQVLAVAYDTPIVGWQGRHINTLRLWSAQSGNLIDLEAFNRGDYMRAVEEQVLAESITRVLYPADATEAGQELRLKQEYFFTSASLQDILRRHLAYHPSLDSLPDKVAIQLNDTHPALAVPELVRLLVDEHGYDWARAFDITRSTIHYTNHTLMPEALERWPVAMLERLLPRHLQIIYEINAQILADLRTRPDNHDPFLSEVSLVEEGWNRAVRMGNLAFVGARKVNGVSALHGELMKRTVFARLHHYFPDKITAVTNGVTPRRWLLTANPQLASLISEAIGEGWIDDAERLSELVPFAADIQFRERFAAIKRNNKEALASLIEKRTGVPIDPAALFDVQIKRIHEYKRQLLNILEAVALWQAIKEAPQRAWQPRVKIFAGKAAPSYLRAKLVIKLINDVAKVVNNDPDIGHRLKIVFVPNYNVSLAERIIPAGDISEQISTAGMEASGTGNMKLALNGAITMGTLDGANVEIRDMVGEDNIYIFGLTAEEVLEHRRHAHPPIEAIAQSKELAGALALLEEGRFSPDDPGRFRSLIGDLRNVDHFLVTADFAEYWKAQRAAEATYRDRRDSWVAMAIRNTANSGWFSSDRSIRDYAREIWRVPLDG
jgi:glycogen phosphorylase